ncbi:hypothetical protein EDB81DRAFT_845584 [Dactylonectria macrodidyma]|uniref:Uncharacterized protein n=1 Tax=Dactylonectria macrodidyma TaxID=307937 RepID=A0A9P9E5D9_9HYPO|nr:hypothetical protein EDB81DRAFT_845584 [Dactylonectria macrodidyma]
MSKKTWFLPPDFTLLPDGEIRLGMVLKYPDRPTLALASLDPTETPMIDLPAVTSIVETNRSYSTRSRGSTSLNLLTKLMDLASASGSADISRYRDLSFGNVDHEIRSFSHELKPEALVAVLQLDSVNEFINGGPYGRWRKRPVYVISGLRVAKKSFSVTKTADSTTSTAGNMSVSGNMSGTPIMLGGGGGVTIANEEYLADGYNTAPGIVFAYRLHMICPKSNGTAESEIFSDTAAFMTGEGGNEDYEEMELTEVTGEMTSSSSSAAV